jgi:diamine N-acetyltransferase
MTITLQSITKDNWRECIKLTTTEAQTHFVATNVVSLAQAYVEPSFVPLAIYHDDTMVGFVMIGRDDQTGADWIIRLMIDQTQQGKGYGRAAMQAVLARIKQQPDCREIRISYEPENIVAETLYDSLGFRPTGEIEHGEVIARLEMQSPTFGGGST